MALRPFSSQTDLASYARKKLQDQIKRSRALVSDISHDVLMRPGRDGGWSAAAILDHLAVMNRLYIPKVERAIANAEPSTLRNWSPTLGGRMIRLSVNTKMKVPTPKVFRPDNPHSDRAAFERFLASQEELLAALDRGENLHWKSVRISSPASTVVKLNLGDVFLVLAEHGDRHLDQMEALLNDLRAAEVGSS